jgi:glutaredoxin
VSTSRVLLVVAVLFGALHLSATRGGSKHDPRKQTGNAGIVMLSATWCGYCDALRKDLNAMGVVYRELDIDGAGRAAFDAVNGRGVPILIVGQEVVYGYNPDRARELIASTSPASINR